MGVNKVRATQMVSQPGYQQDGETGFASMAISSPQTHSLQVVQPIVAFQDGEEAFDVTSLAPVLMITGDPLQGSQRFLAG